MFAEPHEPSLFCRFSRNSTPRRIDRSISAAAGGATGLGFGPISADGRRPRRLLLGPGRQADQRQCQHMHRQRMQVRVRSDSQVEFDSVLLTHTASPAFAHFCSFGGFQHDLLALGSIP